MRPVQKTTAGRESSTADSDSDTKVNVGQSTCSAWLPIESAPKDGTRVILAYDIHDADIGIDYKCGIWVENYGCPGWYADGAFVNPIYWMPIPPLPNANL